MVCVKGISLRTVSWTDINERSGCKSLLTNTLTSCLWSFQSDCLLLWFHFGLTKATKWMIFIRSNCEDISPMSFYSIWMWRFYQAITAGREFELTNGEIYVKKLKTYLKSKSVFKQRLHSMYNDCVWYCMILKQQQQLQSNWCNSIRRRIRIGITAI